MFAIRFSSFVVGNFDSFSEAHEFLKKNGWELPKEGIDTLFFFPKSGKKKVAVVLSDNQPYYPPIHKSPKRPDEVTNEQKREISGW